MGLHRLFFPCSLTLEPNPELRLGTTIDSPLDHKGNVIDSRAARVLQNRSYQTGLICSVTRGQSGRWVDATEMVSVSETSESTIVVTEGEMWGGFSRMLCDSI